MLNETFEINSLLFFTIQIGRAHTYYLNKKFSATLKRFQNLVLISKLEGLNLPFHTVDRIDKTDKMSLVESILRYCSHMPQGIALVVDLCVQYSIFETALWSKLLTRLLVLGLVQD